jgi:hypothetical protein
MLGFLYSPGHTDTVPDSSQSQQNLNNDDFLFIAANSPWWKRAATYPPGAA